MSTLLGRITLRAPASMLQSARANIMAGLMLVLCTVSACAPLREGTSGPAAGSLPPPARVVVEDFVLRADALAPDASGVPMSGDLFRSDPDTMAVLSGARTTAGVLSRQIAAELRQRGWPVVRSAEVASGSDDLRVTGEFFVPDDNATKDVLGIALPRTPLTVATHVLILMQRAGQAVVIDQFDARGKGSGFSAIEEPRRVLTRAATGEITDGGLATVAQRPAPAPEDIRRVARAIVGRLFQLFEKNRWTPPPGANAWSTSSS